VEKDDLLLVAFSGRGVSLEAKVTFALTMHGWKTPAKTLVRSNSIYDRVKKSKAALKIMLVDASRDDPTPAAKRVRKKWRPTAKPSPSRRKPCRRESYFGIVAAQVNRQWKMRTLAWRVHAFSASRFERSADENHDGVSRSRN